MPKFRKKPVVIEARQLTKSNYMEIKEWINKKGGNGAFLGNGEVNLVIPTLEGNMRADCGDYIIKGVNGEFYPCKADIFAKTYEPV